MVTEVKIAGYAEVEDIFSKAMKIVQRKLDNGKLKVKLLNGLVELQEVLENEGKEPSESG